MELHSINIAIYYRNTLLLGSSKLVRHVLIIPIIYLNIAAHVIVSRARLNHLDVVHVKAKNIWQGRARILPH